MNPKLWLCGICIAFFLSNKLFAETQVINDLVMAVSMPSYPYPFKREEAEIRAKMANMKNYFNQVTRGAITFNFDLDHDGQDELFHIVLPKDIDPCARRNEIFAEAVKLAKLQNPGIEFNHKTLLILAKSCAKPGKWGAMAIGADRIMSKSSLGVYPHEYGHNMGFPHTKRDTNNDGKGEGYGQQDPMEAGGTVFYNAPHIWGKKWFGQCPECFQDWEVKQKNVTIQPLATSEETHPLLIARIADDDEPGKYYFLSYRAPVPGTYEENLRPQAQTGLSIHHASGKFLMTSLIHVMEDNETYTIPNTKITITQHSHDISGVNISATLGYKCALKRHRKPSGMAWGKGSLKYPYAICTGEQLAYLSQHPNLWSKVFKLAADVNLASVPFTTIGNEDTPFTGTFLGNFKTVTVPPQQPLFGTVAGATIRDFNINGAILEPNGEGPSGIVAQVARGSAFTNITVNDFSMTAKNNQGIIAGFAERSTMHRMSVNGIIKYENDIENIGGLVGHGSELIIEQSKAQLILRALTPSKITNVGSLVGQLNKSSILNSYALSDYYLWPSHKSLEAVGSLIGRAANVELKQVYFSGDVNAHPSQNPASLAGEIADAPNESPDTILTAQGALLAIRGNRETLVGEKVTLETMYSADFLLAKGFNPDLWLFGSNSLPKLEYEYDPDEAPDINEDEEIEISEQLSNLID